MDLKEQYSKVEQWLLANPNPPSSWPWRWLYHTGRVIYALVRDIVNGQLTLHAMSLVYTTLLSIVPLLALSFSVLKALDVHQRMEPFLYQFFEPLGPQGMELAEQTLSFVDNMKVGVLGSVGLGLLVYTVVGLVQKIERSFNMIWRVPDMRSLAQRFSNYLSVIMVGPLLMVSAVGMTATVFSSDFVQELMTIEPIGSIIVILSRLVPFFLVVGAFTFVYTFMPNTRVKIGYAFIGGLIAGISWQAGSLLFASFVADSTKYAAIYSSFAIGISLLIWVYLNWMILLLGSSISFYLQNPSALAKSSNAHLSPELEERIALTIMWNVALPFDQGEAAPQQEELERRMRVPGHLTRRVSDKLLRSGLLTLAGEKGDLLVPARSLDLIRLSDILKQIRKDEDSLCIRLPSNIPEAMMQPRLPNEDPTLAELLRGDASLPEKATRVPRHGSEARS